MKVFSVNEMVFFVSVRVATRLRGASGTGTAFLVSRKIEEAWSTYLVTARHVVEDAVDGDLFLFPSDANGMTLGTPLPYRWQRGFWSFHPDPEVDIAVASTAPIEELYHGSVPDVALISVPETDFVPKWERTDHAMLEAIRRPQPISEVVIIGFPSTYFDHVTGLPIARRGLTASPLSIDFEGRPVFLVDAEIVPGSSGSPVYYVKQGTNPHEYKLLGVVSEVLRWKPLDWIPRPSDNERPLIHLGAVYHAYTISEAIDAVISKPAA